MQDVHGKPVRLNFSMVGDDEFRRRAQPILNDAGVEHGWRRRDPCADRFRSSVCEDWPFLTDADFQLIDRHSNVLDFCGQPYAPAHAGAACRQMLALGARLLEADGWALRCESSGVSHARETWLRFANQSRQCQLRLDEEASDAARPRDRRHSWALLYRCLVDAPVQVYSVFYTRGMHLLGQPELIVSAEELNAATGRDCLALAGGLFETLAAKLLAEGLPFEKGLAFESHHGEPFQASWEAAPAHYADSAMDNPLGRLRLRRPAVRQAVHRDCMGMRTGSGPFVAS